MTEAAGNLTARRLGRTEMAVSALSLGGVGIGGLYGPVPEDAAAGAVRRALDLGINYVDTSPLYKASEARLGHTFESMGGKPAGLYLSTKTGTHPERRGDYSAAGTRWSVQNSLRLLGVDSVDLLLVHDPRSEAELDHVFGAGGAIEELQRMKGEGKLRAIGLGCRPHAYHRRAIHSGQVDVILTFGDYNLVRQTAAPLMAEAASAGVGVILAQAVLAGLLTGIDPMTDDRLRRRPVAELAAALDWRTWAQERGVSLQAVAIQYGLRNPHVGCVLIGAKTAPEVQENVTAATYPLDDAIWQEVEARIRSGAGQAPAPTTPDA
ncbi:MAG: aldo/keto reductase [Chloroflexota bacterium]|nr:aldo/keto reductase [Chloroflexota bacterium]